MILDVKQNEQPKQRFVYVLFIVIDGSRLTKYESYLPFMDGSGRVNW